jgi:Protein of unknown function (DUF3047)
MAMRRGWALCLALLWSAKVAAQGSAEPEIDFLALTTAHHDAELPTGWSTRAVRGQRLPMSRIADSSGVRYMRLSGAGRAGWFYREVAAPIRLAPGRLLWTWRAPLAPRGANVASAATDDAVLRVFVVFGAHERFVRRPRTLFYTMSDGEPAPDRVDSPYRVRIAGRPMAARTWTSVAADPIADYQRIWGAVPNRIVAIGVMQDTDQTRNDAIGDILTLSWRPAHAATP